MEIKTIKFRKPDVVFDAPELRTLSIIGNNGKSVHLNFYSEESAEELNEKLEWLWRS